jgi:hypothetical protein
MIAALQKTGGRPQGRRIPDERRSHGWMPREKLLARRCPVSHLLENVMQWLWACGCEDITR